MHFPYASTLEFLEFLGELASHDDGVVWSEIFLHIRECAEDSVYGFIDYDGIVLILEGFKESFAPLFHWEESEKPEVVHVHPGANKCRKDGRSSGNGNDGNVLLYGPLYEDVGWIGDAGGTNIRYERDIFPFLKKRNNFIHFYISRMSVERDERFGYLIMIQKHLRSSGILAGDDVRFAEGTECPQSDILEISDGCGDYGEQGWKD